MQHTTRNYTEYVYSWLVHDSKESLEAKKNFCYQIFVVVYIVV